MSVTEPSVPRVVATVTVPPLVVRLLPAASFNWTVIADVLVPLAGIEPGKVPLDWAPQRGKLR